MAFQNPLTQRIADFLEEIGIPVRSNVLQEATFLPGVKIDKGEIHVDESRLLQPGDLLHEAGHIAVMSPEKRRTVCGDLGQDPGEEMAAIAWSWAALVHLGLEPQIVFHPEGYHGGSESIVENFSEGRYFGVPLLRWLCMTDDDTPYPDMKTWLRQVGER